MFVHIKQTNEAVVFFFPSDRSSERRREEKKNVTKNAQLHRCGHHHWYCPQPW